MGAFTTLFFWETHLYTDPFRDRLTALVFPPQKNRFLTQETVMGNRDSNNGDSYFNRFPTLALSRSGLKGLFSVQKTEHPQRLPESYLFHGNLINFNCQRHHRAFCSPIARQSSLTELKPPDRNRVY